MAGQHGKRSFGGGTLRIVLGGLAGGALTLILLIVAQWANVKYAALIFALVFSMAALPLIGNLRAFCLLAILTLAPLSLGVSFFLFPHMGGAGALIIDVVDPFLLLLLYFQARDRLKGHTTSYRFPRALLFWGALILLGVGSVVFGVLRTTAANEVFRMLKLLLLVLLIVNELVRVAQFRNAVVALLLGVILQGTIALAQFTRGKQLGLSIIGEATDQDIKTLSDATLLTGDFVYRVSGLFGHANLLAAYMALFLPVAVALVLAPVSKLIKLLAFGALIIGQPALVLTLSRAGWIDFLVAFVMVLVLGATHAVSRRRYLFARLVIVVVTVAVAVPFIPNIVQRLYKTDPSAVEYRIKWLTTASAMIKDNPVFGVGLNNYVFAQLPYGELKTPEEMSDFYGDYWPAVHNSWVLTWAEQGTIGFLLFVGLHWVVITVAVRNLRIRDPTMHALGVGLFAGFVAIMIDGLASFFIRVEAPARMFWIATAMILAIDYWRRLNEESAAPSAARPTAAKSQQAESGTVAVGRWLPQRTSPLR